MLSNYTVTWYTIYDLRSLNLAMNLLFISHLRLMAYQTKIEIKIVSKT